MKSFNSNQRSFTSCYSPFGSLNTPEKLYGLLCVRDLALLNHPSNLLLSGHSQVHLRDSRKLPSLKAPLKEVPSPKIISPTN